MVRPTRKSKNSTKMRLKSFSLYRRNCHIAPNAASSTAVSADCKEATTVSVRHALPAWKPLITASSKLPHSRTPNACKIGSLVRTSLVMQENDVVGGCVLPICRSICRSSTILHDSKMLSYTVVGTERAIEKSKYLVVSPVSGAITDEIGRTKWLCGGWPEYGVQMRHRGAGGERVEAPG